MVPELSRKKIKIKDREYFFNVVNTVIENSVTNSRGMRIHLQEQRMEFLNNVQTTIEKNTKN